MEIEYRDNILVSYLFYNIFYHLLIPYSTNFKKKLIFFISELPLSDRLKHCIAERTSWLYNSRKLAKNGGKKDDQRI